jgi:hypothetical protein
MAGLDPAIHAFLANMKKPYPLATNLSSQPYKAIFHRRYVIDETLPAGPARRH